MASLDLERPRPSGVITIYMKTELEAKFSAIDPADLRAKLEKVGAKRVHPEILMRRKTFDLPDRKLYKTGGWVRVRDEGEKITLSYKQMNDRTLHGTKEITVIVNSFEETCALLRAMGMEEKSYQETKREAWNLGRVEITIDTWPWVPTFVEIEGDSEESVRKAAADLGLDWSKAMHGSVETIYQMHYDFTDEEIDHWPSITFIEPPQWLLSRKRRS